MANIKVSELRKLMRGARGRVYIRPVLMNNELKELLRELKQPEDRYQAIQVDDRGDVVIWTTYIC